MGHSILLVEDNPATRKVVRFALERRGHKVFEAPDARTALQLAEGRVPSVVLLDLVLPDGNGFELAAQLRDKHGGSEAVFIAFSGFLSKLEEARLADVGFDDVIAKPIDPNRLAATVESHLPQYVPEHRRVGHQKLVLLVDDDPQQLKVMRSRMTQLGFDVAITEDCQSALQLAIKLQPDVVIADASLSNGAAYELATAIRLDPGLRGTPLLLVTSSYVHVEDRALARRAGATDLVVRSDELSELVAALEQAFARPVPSMPPQPICAADAPDSTQLVMQLERQLQLNGGLSQRCSSLSAELAVLRHVSEVVLTHQSMDRALDEALAVCFDAGGITSGALYQAVDGGLRARGVGTGAAWTASELESFFGHSEVLHRVIKGRDNLFVASSQLPEQVRRSLLERCGASDILILPLCYLDTVLGALVIFAHEPQSEQSLHYAFAQAVANQIAQVLALSSALQARTNAEHVAQERTAFLDSLLEQAPDLVLYVDPEGIVRYAGRGVSAMVGKSMCSLLTGSSASELRIRLDQVLSLGESVSWEEVNTTLNGREASFWCRMGPIRLSGVVTGALIIARDISEKKSADAQLMAADRMISVGTLAAGVAHEINNPLAAVLANVDLLSKELRKLSGQLHLPAELKELLEDSREASERIRTIVRDLRVFSRGEDDPRGAVDVEHLLESTLRMARAEVRHRARVIKDFGDVPPVQANEGRLGQVLLNLVVNAAQAIPEGNCAANTIRVTTATNADGNVVVRIADTGVGIPRELQPRVFTQFFTTKPSGVGTGLGLSICKRIVQSCGGTIEFDSVPNVGTEFRLVLPAARFPISQRPPASLVPPPLRRGRLLVVDDERMVGVVLSRLLSPEHDVTVADSATAALDLIAEGAEFDLILCDLMMPQVTGMHLHRSLQGMQPLLARRMVFMTGGAFTPWAQQFLGSVDNPRLEKPFDNTSVRTLVNGLIDDVKRAS